MTSSSPHSWCRVLAILDIDYQLYEFGARIYDGRIKQIDNRDPRAMASPSSAGCGDTRLDDPRSSTGVIRRCRGTLLGTARNYKHNQCAACVRELLQRCTADRGA